MKVVYVYVPGPAPAATELRPPPPTAGVFGPAEGDLHLAVQSLTFAAAPRVTLRRRVVARDIDRAVASPGGAYTIAGTAMYTSRGAKGGLAALYTTAPGAAAGPARPIPVTNVDYFRTAFSPDGLFLFVNSHTGLLRDPGSTPKLTVLSVPNLRVVQTVDGVDPYWTGPRTIVFRNGRAPFRLEVGNAPIAIGPVHASYGCTTESFGPNTPCRSDVYTNILAIVPDGSGWIVNDTSDTKHIDRLRIMHFGSGEDHVAFEQNAFDDKIQGPAVSFVSYALPSKPRTCAVYVSTGVSGQKRSDLHCLSLPGERSELGFLGDEALGARWIGNDQLLLYSTGGGVAGVVDLRAHAVTRFSGLPSGGVALDGGRRIVFARTGEIADLDARTITPVDGLPPSGLIEPIPGDPRRFYIRSEDASRVTILEIAEI